MSKKEPLNTIIHAEWSGDAALDPIAMKAIHAVLKSNTAILKNVYELIKSNHNQLITVQSVADLNCRLLAALIPSVDDPDEDYLLEDAGSTDEDGV